MKKIFFILVIFYLLINNFVLASNSDDIVKVYKFDSSELNFIFENNELIDINGAIEKGDNGLFYKNIKIYYDSNLDFIKYDIFENKQEVSISIKKDIESLTNTKYYKTEEISSNIQFIGAFNKQDKKFLLFKYYPIIFLENIN
ncbi:MAG: hypothetical protein ACUVQN_04950, partial [Caldisericia bacterium]